MSKIKAEKKKQKFTLEFEIKCSPKILYSYLSTASGMEGWFGDKVTLSNGDFVFHWGSSEQRARIVSKRDSQMVRFRWVDEGSDEDSYFQFDINKDEITGDVALIITDFTTEEERQEDIMLWNSQIHELMHVLGS